MRNEAENKSYIDNNIIALVGGVGAGSKYFQSLLDLHPELYMIPGYSLLYFYPHYKETLKIKQSRESFVSIMLDRLPLYDSSIMPGSECLDRLGDNGEITLTVNKNIFLEKVLFFLEKNNFNSKNLLLAFHRAHYSIFGIRFKNKKSSLRPFYHLHDEFYLGDFLNDFPNAQIISTIRKPSVNISRRIKSSYLEANKDKLDNFDYKLLEILCLDKFAYYHFHAFKRYEKFNINLIYFDYDDLVKEEYLTVKKICQKLNIEIPKKDIVKPSFSGLNHKMIFYERHRNSSLDSIRSNARKLSKAKSTSLDLLYESLISKNKLPNNILIRCTFSILKLTKFEKEFIKEFYSFKSLIKFCRLLSQEFVSREVKQYNKYHGYYRFKWSVNKFIIFTSFFLKNSYKFLSKYNNFFVERTAKFIYCSIYLFIYFFLLLVIPFTILSRISLQLRLVLLAILNKINKN